MLKVKWIDNKQEIFLLSFRENKAITPDKREYPNIFLILHENICCGYSLEAARWRTSNEYPHHMFLWRNKKNINIFLLKKCLILSYDKQQSQKESYFSQNIRLDISFTLSPKESFLYKIRPDIPLELSLLS